MIVTPIWLSICSIVGSPNSAASTAPELSMFGIACGFAGMLVVVCGGLGSALLSLPWLLPAFRLLAKLKVLRGTPLDPFGRSTERRTERRLIADYEAMLDEVLAKLSPENHHLAVGLAAIPEKIRGFGHVKQQHLVAAKADAAALLEQFRAGAPLLLKAAE